MVFCVPSMFGQKPGRPRVRGFTLIELMVSCAVLALLMVALAGAFSSFAQVTGSSTKRLEASKNTRTVFDRLSIDLSSAINQGNITNQFYKNRRAASAEVTKNDALVFLANSRTTLTNSRMAVIGYDVGTITNAVDNSVHPTMVRSVQPLRWEDDTTQITLPTSSEAQPLTAGVFRFELAFLKTDGTIVKDPPASSEIKAVICAVATLDESSLNRVPDKQELVDALEDAVDGRPPVANWGISNLPASLPASVRENIRFQQRYFYFK